MDAKDERSKDDELTPTTPVMEGDRKGRTLRQAVEAYWARISDQLDGPHASSGGELV